MPLLGASTECDPAPRKWSLFSSLPIFCSGLNCNRHDISHNPQIPEASEFSKLLNLFTMMTAAMAACVFVVAVVAWTCHKYEDRLRPVRRGYVRVRQHAH